MRYTNAMLVAAVAFAVIRCGNEPVEPVAAPAIVLSATDVPLRLYDTSLEPVEQTLDVTSDGGPLLGLNAGILYADGQPSGWLSADLDQTTAPAKLRLRARAGGLARGTYSATVVVRGANPLTAARNAVVTLQVARDPATFVGTYQLAPVPLIRCTTPVGVSLSATMDRFAVVAATEERIDVSGLLQVGSGGLPFHLSMPFGPRDSFAGSAPFAFSQAFPNSTTVAGTGTIAVDAAFVTDDEFLARIDATLDAAYQVELLPPFPPLTGDLTCSPLSFTVRATK